MSSSTGDQVGAVTLGVPSEAAARLGRRSRSFERRHVPVPDLRGTSAAVSGVVVLPLHLDWSSGGYEYDMADRGDRARLYERVLTEGTADDITSYVNLDLLIDVWDEMVLPAHVREAWQETVDRQRG